MVYSSTCYPAGMGTSQIRLLFATLLQHYLFSKMLKFPKCADPESFVRGAPTLKCFFFFFFFFFTEESNFDTAFLFLFLVDEGSGYPNTTKIGPLLANQRNAI